MHTQQGVCAGSPCPIERPLSKLQAGDGVATKARVLRPRLEIVIVLAPGQHRQAVRTGSEQTLEGTAKGRTWGSQ